MKTIWILLLGLMVLSCKKDDVYNNIPNKYIPDNEIGDTLVFADSALAIIKYVCTGSNTSYYKYRNSSHYETYDQSYRGEFTPLVIDEEPLTINIFPSDVAVSLISNSLAKLRYQKSFSSVNSSSIFSEEIFGFTYNNLVNLVESYPGSSRHARYDLFKGIVSYQDTLGKEWKLKEIKR